MDTPPPDWLPAAARNVYPGWVQRKAVTLSKRDQKRGGTGNVQQYRLAIHAAVLSSAGRDHWTGEWLDWELIGTYDSREAAAGSGEQKQEHRKLYALVPTLDQPSHTPEPCFVVCAWRTKDAKQDMTAAELLQFCSAIVRHSPQWAAEPSPGPTPQAGAALNPPETSPRSPR